MLQDTPAFSGFSVRDLGAAKQFYAAVLGLKVTERPEGLELHIAQGGRIFVYPSQNNRPADFTILNFMVPDIDASVGELAAKGVVFEQYDTPPIKTDAKGIARREGEGMGPRAMAWFKDPSGNILGLLQES